MKLQQQLYDTDQFRNIILKKNIYVYKLIIN